MDSAVLGSRIRQAREALGLSQEELAARVAKSQKAISQYESGTRRMFVNDLDKLAAALQVPVAYLLTGEIILNEVDELVVQQMRRLDTVEAKLAALQLLRAFCDFVQAERGRKAP